MPRIVAFTKDWNDVPTCTTHVLRGMGRSLPVLWIESIGTRKPNLASPGDLSRVWRKLRSVATRAELKENNLRVLAPVLIPKTESAAGRFINRCLMRWMIRRELHRMGGEGRVEYWCFVPNAVDLLPGVRCQPSGRFPDAGYRMEQSQAKSASGIRHPASGFSEEVSGVRCQKDGDRCVSGRALNERTVVVHRSPPATGHSPLVVYYCVDDWSQFHNLDGAWLARKEEEILKRADVVFTPARHLEEKCRRAAGGRVHYMPHGVEHAAFARALSAETVAPADVAGLRRPVIGFYGNLHPWVDFGLVGALARRRPQWSFVLIGEVFCDVSPAAAPGNVHFLGRREHGVLPDYCKAFDAAMIPYDMKQARMASVNPVKTKELLAAGVPIAAADVPELRGYGEDVLICRGVDEWEAALAKQIARADRREISARVAGEDWTEKIAAMRRIVEAS